MFNTAIVPIMLNNRHINYNNKSNNEIIKMQLELKKKLTKPKPKLKLTKELINKYKTFPQTHNEIVDFINTHPNDIINQTDYLGNTLLDYTIQNSLLKTFEYIIEFQNILPEILFHSLNYLNKLIYQLPKNKTRPIMKKLLVTKLTNNNLLD